MDRITSSLVKEFKSDFEYGGLTDNVIFEYFSNYVVLTREYGSEIDLDSVWTGEGGDGGIDGIALIVNNRLVYNNDEMDEIGRNSRSINVDFVFIQSKMSSSFDGAEILCRGQNGFLLS